MVIDSRFVMKAPPGKPRPNLNNPPWLADFAAGRLPGVMMVDGPSGKPFAFSASAPKSTTPTNKPTSFAGRIRMAKGTLQIGRRKPKGVPEETGAKSKVPGGQSK